MSIILNGTGESLRVVLTAAPASTQPALTASWADQGATSGDSSMLANGTTAVTLVAAPAASVSRWVGGVSIYNQDTAASTVTVQKVVSGTPYTVFKATVQPGSQIFYDNSQGWRVIDANGAAITSASTILAPGYIFGLLMQYVGASAINVSAGQLCMPDGSLLNVPSGLSLSGLTLSASTMYHLYVYKGVGGSPLIEAVTTAPASPYSGTARTKTGDATRRYLGSFVTDSASAIYNFTHVGNTVQYKAAVQNAPFLVIANGAATTPTNVSLAGLIPSTSARVMLSTTNADAAVPAIFGASDQGYTLSPGSWSSLLNPSAAVVGNYVIDGSQQLQYMYRSTPSGVTGVNARIIGYDYNR